MNNIFYINIGDWSEDGHGYCERFLYHSNYSLNMLQMAYKNSCKKTNVDLRNICCDYLDNHVDKKTANILLSHGLNKKLLKEHDDEEYYICSAEDFADIIMWFIGLSMPNDFSYQKVQIQNFNGFWNPKLNDSFGYGLFE